MPIQTLHLRSNVQGKEPVAGTAAGQLPVGSIGINFNKDEPFLTIQDSAGAIRRIAGIKVGAAAPASPTAGEAWLDISVATKPVFKVHDGTAWQGAGSGVSTGSAAPAAPAAGDLWVDTTTATAPVLKVYNGTAFVAVTPDATDAVKGVVELATATETVDGVDTTRAVTPAGLKSALGAQAGSSTAPAAPVTGQVWVDSSTSPSTIKVWNGTAWIPQAGATVTSATAPTTPATGQIWIDTSASPAVTKIWDGTAWVTATPDGSAAAAIANDAKYATKAEMPWVRTGTNTVLANAGDRVGLGTATPAATLEVNGTSYVTDLLIRNNTGTPSLGTSPWLYSPANGTLAIATNAAERMRIDSSGRVGIGTASPSQLLEINSASNPCVLIKDTTNNVAAYTFADDNAAIFGSASDHPVAFRINNTERARIDSSGRLLVGTSSSNSVGGHGALLQVESTDYAATIQAVRNANGVDGAYLFLGKSRGTTAGSMTVVQNGDELGNLRFYGADGSTMRGAAEITCKVDGTPGASDMPGRLVFSTTADGASTPTERMIISQDSTIRFGNTVAAPAAPAFKMTLKASGILNLANTPTYADNTAAKAGGLVNGDIYRKATGELMIAFT